MGIVRKLFYSVAIIVGIAVVVILIRGGYADKLLHQAPTIGDVQNDVSQGVVSEGASIIQDRVTDTVERNIQDGIGNVLGVEEGEFFFDVVADIEPDYSTYGKHLDRMNNDGSRLFFVNGDITEKGTTEQFDEFETFTRDHITIPYYSIPGNHDILQDGDTSTFASHFGYRYKSFDYNNAHFILLDNASAARGFDEKQRDWLAQDLDATTQPHVFLFMHRPLDVPFASVVLGKENELKEDNVSAFVEILKAHDVDAIFAAHVPGYIQYDLEETGIPIYASGGGGTPSSISFLESDYHYLHVRVSEQTFRVEKIDLSD